MSDHPIEIIRPWVSPEQAVKLCDELYNFSAITCKELVSYDDRNFLVTGHFADEAAAAASGVPTGSQQPTKVVLKIANSIESEGVILEKQCRLMQHLSEAGLKVQSVMKSRDGAIVVKQLLSTPADSSGHLVDRHHAVRMLSYLPGAPMGESPMTANMLETVAMEVGRVDSRLTKRFLNDPDFAEDEKKLWSLLSAPKLINYVSYVHGEARQTMVREIVQQFCSVVTQDNTTDVPFTKAFIHGDPNESNILVDGEPPQFSGLLDWQDAQPAYAVFDLALMVMYAGFVKAKEDPTIDPFRSVVPPLIRGYTREFPLTDAELRQLPLLVATRFAQSLTLGAYSYARDPGNDYLLTTACSWSTLDRLWNGHKHRLEQLGCEWLDWACSS